MEGCVGKWLSPRQCEVLLLLADGSSFAWAAGKMGVTENTAKSLASYAYRKLGVHNKYDAVAKHKKHRPMPNRECMRIG